MSDPAEDRSVRGNTIKPHSVEAENVKADSVNTGSLNSDTYVSPGDDLQSSIDDTPAGGRLIFEAGRHDIAVMGVGRIDKPLSVIMSGGEDGAGNTSGAYIDNSGTDVVNSPVFTVKADSSDNRQYGVTIINPVATHEAPDNPFIEVQKAPFTTVVRPFINCNSGTGYGAVGLTSSNQSWAFQMWGGRIIGPKDYGIDDRSGGGLKQIHGTQIAGGAGGVGIRANNGWYINYPDLATETGVQVIDGPARIRPRLESTTKGVVVGPSSEVGSAAQRVIIDGLDATVIDDVCVEFDNATDCMILDPERLADGSTSGAAVRWTENSVRCGIRGNKQAIHDRTWDIAAGAVHPSVSLRHGYKMGTGTRDAVSDPVEGMSIYNTSTSQYEYYDGSAWVAQ